MCLVCVSLRRTMCLDGSTLFKLLRRLLRPRSGQSSTSPPHHTATVAAAVSCEGAAESLSDGVVLVDAGFYQLMLTEVRTYQSQLVRLQQLLHVQDTVSAGTNTDSSKSHPECSHCMRHLAAVGSLQQENTHLMLEMSAMKQSIGDKEKTIESLQRQLACMCSSSTFSSDLLSTNNNSVVLHHSDEQNLVNNYHAVVVNGNQPTSALCSVNHSTVVSLPDSSSQVSKMPLQQHAVVRRCSSGEDTDDVFEHRRRLWLSRQQSEDSGECFASIFDYRSQLPSIELDEELGDLESIPGEVASLTQCADRQQSVDLKQDANKCVSSSDKLTSCISEQNREDLIMNGLAQQSTDDTSKLMVDEVELLPVEVPLGAVSTSALSDSTLATSIPQPLCSVAPPVDATSTTTRPVSRLPAPKSTAIHRLMGDKRQPLVNGLLPLTDTASTASDVKTTKLVQSRFR